MCVWQTMEGCFSLCDTTAESKGKKPRKFSIWPGLVTEVKIFIPLYIYAGTSTPPPGRCEYTYTYLCKLWKVVSLSLFHMTAESAKRRPCE